jgi:hypothetical protein
VTRLAAARDLKPGITVLTGLDRVPIQIHSVECHGVRTDVFYGDPDNAPVGSVESVDSSYMFSVQDA